MSPTRASNRVVCFLLIAGTIYGTLPLPARGCGCALPTVGRAPVKTDGPAPCCEPSPCCTPTAGSPCCCGADTDREPTSPGCECLACECGVPTTSTPPVDPTPPSADESAGTYYVLAPAVSSTATPVAGTSAVHLADRQRSIPPDDLVISLSRMIC